MEQEGITPVDIRELAEHLCKLVVKIPDKVVVKETSSGRTRIVTAQVDDDDIGRVIGKQGTTIRSIRVLLDQVGKRMNQKIYFEIKNKIQTKTTTDNDPSAENQSTSKENTLPEKDTPPEETPSDV